VEQSVLVSDTTPPTLAQVPDSVAAEFPEIPLLETPSSSDACHSSSVGTTVDFVRDGCTFHEVYTWVATDDCGNESPSATRTVTVTDNHVPVISVPADVTVEPDQVPLVGEASCSDHGGAACSVTFDGETRRDGTHDCDYSLVRTWTATDLCGQASVGVQTITVEDRTDPLLLGSFADVEIQCDQAVPNCAVDAFDVCEVQVTHTQEQFDTYIVETWTATDASNNQASESRTVTTVDNTPPFFARAPLDFVGECDCDTVPSNAPPRAFDNCASNPTVLTSQTLLTPEGTWPSVVVRSWSVQDEAGNEATHSYTITLQDTTPPDFKNQPTDLEVSCDHALPDPEVVSAFDACDTAPTVAYAQLRQDGQTCGSRAFDTYLRTWTATDENSNQVSHTQTIQVVDKTAPTLDSTSDLCIVPGLRGSYALFPSGAGGELQSLFAAQDSCGGAVTVRLNNCSYTGPEPVEGWTRDTTAPVCGIHSGANPNFYVELGPDVSYSLGYTASDECGNERHGYRYVEVGSETACQGSGSGEKTNGLTSGFTGSFPLSYTY
jgi:hypothetical protein